MKGRIAPIISLSALYISQICRYLGPDFNEESNLSKEAVSMGHIPALAKSSFPLCMAVSDLLIIPHLPNFFPYVKSVFSPI